MLIGDTSKIELEFGCVGFWGEGKTGAPGEKPLGARTRTNNKLNPHCIKRWIKKLVFLELIRLYLKKLTPKKVGLHRLTFAHVMCHAILFLQHIFWYCSTMLLLWVCLRLSDDKFRESNVLTCPASCIYYSTNHNDGVEDYFYQTDNG